MVTLLSINNIEFGKYYSVI